MTKLLRFTILTVLSFSFVADSQQTCTCVHVETEEICRKSILCQWIGTQCLNKYNIQEFLNDKLSHCAQFLKEDCYWEPECSWINDECVSFVSCELNSLNQCKQASFWCIQNGSVCAPRQSCHDYDRMQLCQSNQGIDQKYCFWDPDSTPKCQPVRECEQLPDNLIRDSQCRFQLSFCAVRKGGGCMKSATKCDQHSFQEQCFTTLDQNQECLWINEKCVDKKCENLPFQSNELCQKYIKGCVSDGMKCVQIGFCEEAKVASSCTVDKLGQQCVFYEGYCYLRVCEQAPISVKSLSQCQTFAASDNCIPAKGSGCRLKPLNCSEYDDDLFCKWGNCFWSEPLLKCKVIDCSDAPQGFTNQECLTWIISDKLKCIGKLGGGCQALTDCANIQMEEACVSNNEGQKCFWLANQCQLLKCENLRYPYFRSDQECNAKLQGCKFNFTEQRCAEIACANILPVDLCNNSVGLLCANNKRCIKKSCNRAPYTLVSHLECEQFKQECTVNVFTMNQERLFVGCMLKLNYCHLYLHQEQCHITVNQEKFCYWKSGVCVDRRCEHAPNTYNNEAMCTQWLPNCLLKSSQDGCISKGLTCESLQNTTGCLLGVSNELKCALVESQCVSRTCDNAPQELISHSECRQWLSTCVLNLSTHQGCQTEPSPSSLCSSAPNDSYHSNHEECHSWNNQCTVGSVTSSCMEKKAACLEYSSELNCRSTLSGQPCVWNGSICVSTSCFNAIVLSKTYEACHSFHYSCTVNQEQLQCTGKQYSCSSYDSMLSCTITSANQQCIWVNNLCTRKLCKHNKTSTTEIECLNYLTQQACQLKININGSLGPGCENRILDCKNYDNKPLQCELASYQIYFCKMKPNLIYCDENQASTSLDCNSINSSSLRFCKIKSKWCTLHVSGIRCNFESCQNINQQTLCNSTILNDGTKCFYSSNFCRMKQCQDIQKTNTSECQSELEYCYYQIGNSCTQLSNCSFLQQTNCELAWAISGGQKYKCQWDGNQCQQFTNCSLILNPKSYSNCADLNPNCTIKETINNSGFCMNKKESCNQYMNEESCKQTTDGNKCRWSDNNCMDDCSAITPASQADCDAQKCSYNNSQTVCQKRQSCSTYDNSSTFGIFGISQDLPDQIIRCNCPPNESCEDRACENTPSDSCQSWLPQCKLDQSPSQCRVARCDEATLLSYTHETCESFLLTCTLNTTFSACIQLTPCGIYTAAQCYLDQISKKCYWSNEYQICKELKCENIDLTVQTHDDCQNLLHTCTIKFANNTLGGCQDKKSTCDQYQQEDQCHLTLDNIECIWQHSTCQTKSDFTSCELYSQLSCLIPEQKNSDGVRCFWNGTSCSEMICENAPASPELTDEDCQKFDQGCMIDVCRDKICEDFPVQTDARCALLLPDHQCTTDGTRCIRRQSCEATQNEISCTYDVWRRDCVWDDTSIPRCQLKSCSTAPQTLVTAEECKQFLPDCVPLKAGGCKRKGECYEAEIFSACTSDSSGKSCIWDPITQQCLLGECVPVCGDGIVAEGLEECDDVNNIPYDGCYQCKMHCVVGCRQCVGKQCMECEQGWQFKDSSTCEPICGDGLVFGKEQCDDMNNEQYDGCYQCKFQCHKQCDVCNFGDCSECKRGWVTFEKQCAAQCGDGIVIADYEQCDDGNYDNMDGCSTACQVEDNWKCDGEPSSCQNVNRPSLVLSYNSKASESSQEITVLTNQKVKYTQGAGAEFIKYLEVSINGATEKVDFTYEVKAIVEVSHKLSEIEYLIKINFLRTLKPTRLEVVLKKSILVNEFEQTLSSNLQAVYIQPPYLLSKEQLQTLQSTNSMNELIVYILLGVSGLAILTGDFKLFWNLLDLLQHLSYLIYINIEFPYHLKTYLQIFKMVTLKPLLDLLKVDEIIQLIVGNIPYIPPQGKMKDQQVNAYFIVNAKSFFIIMGSSYATFLLTKLLSSRSIYNKLIYMVQHTKVLYNQREKLAGYIFKFRKAMQSSLAYFYYSGLIRAFISSQYHLNFSALAQIQNPDFSGLNSAVNVLAAYSSLIGQGALLGWLFSRLQLSYPTDSSQYRVILEDVKPTYWGIHYKPFVMLRKIAYMVCIVNFQEYPGLQVFLLSLNSGLFATYIITLQPLLNSAEALKVVINESLFAINTLSFLVYLTGLGDAQFIGWLHIASFSLILAGQLVIDLGLQIHKLIECLTTQKKPVCKEIFIS